MNSLFSVLKAVLSNKLVIIAAVVCFVLMDFASYICRYRKKPAAPKIKRPAAAPSPAPEADDDSGGGDDEMEE